MVDVGRWSVFAAASLGLALVPGPAVMFIVARSLEKGRLAGVVSVLGIAAGSLVHVTAAVLGLSAILMTSSTVFSVVRYAGAAYLIFLGIRNLVGSDPAEGVSAPDETRNASLLRIFRQGLVVNLLNPKTALFFFAFLPQFVEPHTGTANAQILVLGASFVLIALCTDSTYALLAGTVGRWLRGRPSVSDRLRYVSGAAYIALGVGAAIGDVRKR